MGRGVNKEFKAWCGTCSGNPTNLWNGRAVLVHADADPNPNHWIMAAARGTPHGKGMDGYNFQEGQTLKNKQVANDYPGHFCVHFFKSTTHKGRVNKYDGLITKTFNSLDIKPEEFSTPEGDIDPDDVAAQGPAGSDNRIVTGAAVTIKNPVGEKKVLVLANKQQITEVQITDSNLEENKKKLCELYNMEAPVTSIANEQKDTVLYGYQGQELDKKEKIDDVLSRADAPSLYCKAILEYERALSDDTDLNNIVYEKLGDAYNSLSDHMWNYEPYNLDEISKSIARYYYQKVSNPGKIDQKLNSIEEELTKGAVSDSQFLEDEGIYASVVDIIPVPAKEKGSAEITGNRCKPFCADE